MTMIYRTLKIEPGQLVPVHYPGTRILEGKAWILAILMDMPRHKLCRIRWISDGHITERRIPKFY